MSSRGKPFAFVRRMGERLPEKPNPLPKGVIIIYFRPETNPIICSLCNSSPIRIIAIHIGTRIKSVTPNENFFNILKQINIKTLIRKKIIAPFEKAANKTKIKVYTKIQIRLLNI